MSSSTAPPHHRASPDVQTSPPTATHDWSCPFCALLCDDLTLATDEQGTLSALGCDCPRLAQALTGFGPADAACRPIVDSSDVDLDTALDSAALFLSRARRPLLGGLATDVAGARALYPLAAACGAIADHLHGDALMRGMLALQDRGAFFTTLSEVRTRADLLVFIGTQPSRRYPRFYERTRIGTEPPVDGLAARDAVFVCADVDPALAGRPHVRAESLLRDADPYDVLAILSAIVDGRPATALPDRDGTAAQLEALASRIGAASYTVFVCEPGALPPAGSPQRSASGTHAALLIEALHRIVKAVNRKTRAGCLTLGGDDGALSVNQTFTWLSGLPLRTRIGSRLPGAAALALDHDPHRHATARLIGHGDIDMLLWVASFGPHGLPAVLDARVPAVVLGHPALAAAARARGTHTVFIPVATPGIDTDGHLFRTDGSIVVPLRPARAVPLPSVGTVAARLVERLAHAASGSARAGSDQDAGTPRADAHSDAARPAAAPPDGARR